MPTNSFLILTSDNNLQVADIIFGKNTFGGVSNFPVSIPSELNDEISDFGSSQVNNYQFWYTNTISFLTYAGITTFNINSSGTITHPGSLFTGGTVNAAAGVFVGNVSSATMATGILGATTGNFVSLNATFKLFDIPHPQKENYRLRHGSLEGPELGVYVRGKTSNETLVLPEYWEHLVDSQSITAHLTPTSPTQTLFVESVSEKEVVVKGTQNLPYYYHIMAERKDVPKLETEILAE